MPRNKEDRPEWFKFWRRNRWQLDIEQLSMESRGIIFTNAMRYFDAPEDELLSMTPLEAMAFNILKISIDESTAEYSSRAEVNRANGRKGGRPPKGNGNPNNPMGFFKTELTQPNPNNPKIEGRGQRVEGRGDDLAGKPQNKHFQPPSVEEVAEYCQGRGNSIDPAQFVDWYAARDWQLSRGVRMKDWRAAVRTWERNSTTPTEPQSQPDFSWRMQPSTTPADLVEDPPGSGNWKPRGEA